MNRNDPCHCGSGRKFKKCHGAPSATGADLGTLSIVRRSELARAAACKTLDVQLHDAMLAWAARHLGPEWIENALKTFSWHDLPEVEQDEEMLLGTWMLYHMPISDTDPMPLAWRYREAARLHRDPAKERLVDAQLEATIGVWEIQSIERGVGSQVKCLLTGTERFIYDASSTETLEPWLGLLGYVVDCDGISFFGGLHYQPLSPLDVDEIVRATRKAARVRTRAVSRDFLESPDRQLDLIDQWRIAIDQMHEAIDKRVMHNTDGEEISIQTERFDVSVSRAEILRILATIPGAEPPVREGKEDFIAVLREASSDSVRMGPTVVGQIVLNGKVLNAETNSVARADALKAAIEDAGGDAVQFRIRKSESMQSLRERSPATPSHNVFTSESENMPPEVREAMRQMMAKYDAQWPDTKIPALGNVTPRVAARDPKLRPVLERLLKDMESRGVPPGMGMGMDIAAIRRELGV